MISKIDLYLPRSDFNLHTNLFTLNFAYSYEKNGV